MPKTCMGNRWSSGRSSSRVVQTKPFSFSLLKQAKRELMSVDSLSKYNYSRRVHLIFLSYHLWSCEKSPGLCLFHRAPVDMPGHFLHAPIFKFIQLPQFVQFFLEGHLMGRTSCTRPHPQFSAFLPRLPYALSFASNGMPCLSPSFHF